MSGSTEHMSTCGHRGCLTLRVYLAGCNILTKGSPSHFEQQSMRTCWTCAVLQLLQMQLCTSEMCDHHQWTHVKQGLHSAHVALQ